ncbi:MAG: hypothetical protein L3J83_04275 [Proteobacteria bacterium]|nr:hypothetical protein [Pseudomonadota bacterium]
MDEGERDFNQTVVYAKDTPPIDVLDAATRLPMMSDKQVVIVKEAHEYKKTSQWEIFEQYFESPSKSTVLIFAYKSGFLGHDWFACGFFRHIYGDGIHGCNHQYVVFVWFYLGVGYCG